MKKILITVLVLAGLSASSQDSTSTKKIANDDLAHHEIGINATLLIKQVLSLSTTNVTLLPYDLTYKYISNKWAFRTGLGIMSSSSTNETTSTTTSTVTPGPDASAPTTNKFFQASYRAGIEYRVPVKNWLLGYAGIDIAGVNSKSTDQSSNVFNNLPFSYQYTRTTDVTTTTSIGAGPVLGLQFYINKRLSIFTEIPIYIMHTRTVEDIDDYRNVLQGSNIYVSTDNTQTQTTTGNTFRIILPATVYVAFKF
jgi:hypothetical protein